MRRLYIILYITISSLFLIGGTEKQDIVSLKHVNYTSTFSISKKYPIMVEWWITKSMVSCEKPLKRKDNFKPDPLLNEHTNLLKDYINSGLDRGHMMPAADNLCQSQLIQDECFYFSNISPQYSNLNSGDWKSLESMIRNEAKIKDSIHVWSGNIGETRRIGRVAVPKQCWKVIYIKKENKWLAYLFDNDTSRPDGIENNKTTVEEISKLTGFVFK